LWIAVCGSEPQQSPSALDPGGGGAVRVLMLTATAGFRHDSIPAAVAALRELASATRQFSVTATEDVSLLTASTLAGYDVVMFALTTGELPLGPQQRTALIDFVHAGGGFIGVHSATDTLYDWPDYGRLVGAYFREHPWTQQASVIVEDPSHPATAGLGAAFSIREEFYTFRDNPRGRVGVLLRLDPRSVGAEGDYPLAWAHTVGAGRAYYNALGHFAETWGDARFRGQIAGAIRWAAGR
jgi:type 1 glutamine amidotransferase